MLNFLTGQNSQDWADIIRHAYAWPLPLYLPHIEHSV